MKKILFSVVLLCCVTLAWAFVQKTEKMTVVKNDGTTVEYNVADIERVNFSTEEENIAFLLTSATGDEVKLDAIPTVFRVDPETEGAPYAFGISMVQAATPADARQGQYAVEITVGQTKLNTADVDLTGGANSGVTVKLYSYKDGEVDKEYKAQKSGTLSTSINSKTKQVTIELDATFDDGTNVLVDYTGAVVVAENLQGFNPPFVYVNQGQYFNADNMPGGIFDVTDMTYEANVTKRGVSGDLFTFTLSNGKDCWFILDSKYFGETFDFATAEAGECYFYYDNIQLVSKGTPYMNQGTEGTINVVKNADGSFVVDFKVSNFYIPSWGGGVMGTPEYVVLNYTSGIVAPEPEPEPEPVVLVDQLQVTDNDGVVGEPKAIVKCTRTEDAKIPYNSSVKGDRFEFSTGEDNEPVCYIILKPELIGTTVDIASAEAQSFYFKYGATEIAASDLSFLSEAVGTQGTIEVMPAEDGAYVINLNISYKTTSNPEAKGSFRLNYTLAAPEPEPEPEPDPVVYKNQGQYFDANGDGEAIFDVLEMKYTPGVTYRNVTGSRFDFTLSNGETCYFVMPDEYINDVYDFATVKGANKMYFVYGSSKIVLMSQGSFMNEGYEGTIKVVKGNDDTFTIDIDVTNRYYYLGSKSGNGAKIILNYSNAKEEEENPDPTPTVSNEGAYYNLDGEPTAFTVEDMKYTPGASYRGVSGSRFDFTLSNGTECFFVLNDSYLNNTFDFSEVKVADQIYFKYGNIVLCSQKSLMFEGTTGTVKVTKNADDTFVIEVDVTNKYLSWGSEAGTPERVVLTYSNAPQGGGEVEPDPVPTVSNEGAYYNLDGEPAGFTVEDMKYTPGASYRGVSGSRFDFTLSNGTECFFVLNESYLNNTFDFSEVKVADQIYFKYGNIVLCSQKSLMFEGTTGTVKVTKNDEDTFVIEVDVTNKYLSWGSEAGTPERVVLTFAGASK